MGLLNGRKKVHTDYLGNFERGITYNELLILKNSVCYHLREAGVLPLSEDLVEDPKSRCLVISLEGGGSIRFGPGSGTPAGIVFDSRLNRKQIAEVLEKVELDLLEKGFRPFARSDHCFFTR